MPGSLKATLKSAAVPPEIPPAAAKTSDSAPGTAKPASKPGKTGDSAPGTTRVPDALKSTMKGDAKPPAAKTGDSAPGTAKVPDAIKAGLRPPVKKAAPFKPPPKKPADGVPPVDAEELAANLLFEDEKKPEPVDSAAPGKPIKTECFFCGEAGEYPPELAGKQAPCLYCKRIIKIPLPVSDKPKDWRDVEKRPTGAKRDLAELDDAWGTDIRANVGLDTLEATGAVEIKRPREPLPVRLKRWATIATGVAILLAIGWYAWKLRSHKKQQGATDAALALLEKDRKGAKQLSPEAAAEIYRSAGEFFLREGDLQKAEDNFKAAQGVLHQPSRQPLERDLGLVELAIAITEMAGNKEEVLDRKRIKWEDVQILARPTVGKISSPDTRIEAAHRLTRRLIARGHNAEEREALARQAELLILRSGAGTEERPELLARIGIELFMAGETTTAESLATKAFQPYILKPDAKQQPLPPPPVSAALGGLLVALGKQNQANDLVGSWKSDQGAIPQDTRVAYALGWALQDKWDDARKLAAAGGGEAIDRFITLLTLAELAEAKGKTEEAANLVTEAAKLITVARTPWMRYRLFRVGARVGKASEMRKLAETQFVAKDLTPWLHRAQVDILRGELLGRPSAATDEMRAEAEKKEQAFAPALALLARHNARYGSGDGTRSEVERWEPESLRAVGLIGVALGLQDHAIDAPTETTKR